MSKSKGRRALFFAVLTAILALGAWMSVSAGEVFPPTQLTNNGYDDYLGGVSADRVVWDTYDGNDYEVYTWTPGGGAVKLTNNSYDDYSYGISGDRIVWVNYGASDTEICTWTPSGGSVQITNNSDDDILPLVSGDRVVWQGWDGSDWEVFTWTPTDGTVQLTTNIYDDYTNGVSGDRVVWSGDDGSDYEIYTWTPTGGIVQLTNNSDYDDYPAVSGDRVVWESTSDDWETQDIYTWTPSGTVQITNDQYDFGAVVSGDRVAWSRWGGDSEINDTEMYTWTPSGGSVRLTNNGYDDYNAVVSGDRVVWVQEFWYDEPGYSSFELTSAELSSLPAQATDRRAASTKPRALDASGVMRPTGFDGPETWLQKSNVYTWTPSGGAIQVASYAQWPYLSGDRVAWHTFDPNGIQDMEVITSVAHERYDDKDTKITYLPGWSRWDNSGYWAATEDTYAYTDKKGDKAMVTFEGTRLYWVACTSNTKGKAKVSLYDGAAEPGNLVSSSTVDLYSSSTKWKQRVYDTGILTDSTYTLVIECLYEKNPAAWWYTIDVDGFDIQGTLVQSPAVTPVDDKDYTYCAYTPGIAAAGASTDYWSRWDDSIYWAASNNTYAYTDQLGYKVTFTFDGTYASWIACTSNTKGKAKVSLYDGAAIPGNLVSSSTVDLYSPITLWKQRVYDTGILAPGTHTIEIECLGTKNPSSWYHTIDADRFDAILTP